MTTPLARTFLAYARQGLAAQITQPASETAALPGRAGLAIGVTVNAGTPAGLGLQLYGPGDVIGFDEGQITRTEPAPDSAAFEPDLLACVEFARPDLPWLLTPGAPDPANGRLVPWLALVVVGQQDAAIATVPGQPLPVLSCQLAELPDLSESWAWAHAQVSGPPTAPAASLITTPGAALSRLVCPRRLAPGMRYYACIVPAFSAGVAAGLGQPPPAGPLAPAWGPGSPATVQLPVYYHWAFSTGPAGDFATLAGLLRPVPLAAELGLRAIDISAADPEIPAPAPPGGVLTMPGAAGSGGPADAVPAVFAQALAAVLAGGATGVGPPVYGGLQAGTGAALPPAGSPPQWLRELNLDPRYRAAAGLGTQVVQNLSEQLMASAWAQAGQAAQAAQGLQRAQAASAAAGALHRKHLPPPSGGAAGGPAADRAVQLAGPAHARIRPATAAQTVAAQVAASPPSAAAASTGYRRLASPLGPLARRLGAAHGAPLPPPLTPLTSGSLVVTPQQPTPAGAVTLDAVAGGPGTYDGITPQFISGASPWWQGAGGGFGAPPDGFWSDLIAFRAAGSGIGWRVGQHLSFAGQPVTGWQPEQTVPAGTGPPQAVAAAAYLPSGAATAASVAVVSIAPPGAAARAFQLQIGSGVGTAGAVTSWSQPVPIGPASTAPVLGADIVIGAFTVLPPDLLLIWTEQEPGGAQAARYLLQQDLGSPIGSKTATAVQLPFTPAGDIGAAAGAIGPAQPGGSDVLVWWISGPPGARTGQYVIGWQFGANGARSWSAPMPVPVPFPDAAVGLGAALADISNSGRPDLVLFFIAQDPPAPGGTAQQFAGQYLIGWDLSTAGVPAGGWSSITQVPGDWSATGAGGSLSIASLDPARLTGIAAAGAAFQQQAGLVQQSLLGPGAQPAPPQQPPPFTAATLAGAVTSALDPAVTVPARQLSQIDLQGATLSPPAGADPLAPLSVTPSFPQPMYPPLRDLAATIMLPSVQQVPPDSVTLLQADPAFIESYLVGLNHEMSRLLAWRGFPSDGTGTYFQSFWDRPPGSAGGPDIPPISAWDPAAPLGGHATSAGGSGMLMLLIRGQLPARYPGLLVRASRAAFAPGPGGPGAPAVLNPTDVWLDPVFSLRVEPDVSCYGFALTPAQARSSGGTPPDPGWFFVLAEQPSAPRFGLEPLPQPPAYGGTPASWADLNWGQLATSAAGYAALSQISAAHPPAGLAGLTLGGSTFGRNAAHMAAITLRLPFQVAIHADEMLQGL